MLRLCEANEQQGGVRGRQLQIRVRQRLQAVWRHLHPELGMLLVRRLRHEWPVREQRLWLQARLQSLRLGVHTQQRLLYQRGLFLSKRHQHLRGRSKMQHTRVQHGVCEL